MQRDSGAVRLEIGQTGAVEVVNPPPGTVRTLVADLHDRASPDVSVRLLATSDRLEAALADWNVATRAADLADGTLALRTDDDLTASTVRATEDVVRVFVFGEPVETTDAETSERVRERIDERWDAATAYSVGTPSLSTVETTLAEKLGPETRDDFLAFCERVGSVRSGDVLNERVLLVLAGARNGEQNYEIGQWADYHGFSSRSMINRVKTTMTNAGVLDIEERSGHVGRPWQILTLAADYAGQSRADLLDSVREALA